MLARYLFGRDVFISYARSDGARYASELATSLAAAGLSCFMDQWDSVPGRRVPPRVLRYLRGSSLLVLVGTPSASTSASVLEEVRAFKQTQRNIVPIDVTGALRDGPLAEEILGLPLTVEAAEAVNQGKPSDVVLARIQGAASFKKQSSRIRKASLTAFVLILVAASAAVILNRLRYELEQDIDRAVSTDRDEYFELKRPYDEKRRQHQELGGTWTGDPADPGDLNIDDLYNRESSLRKKWEERWPAEPTPAEVLNDFADQRKQCLESGRHWVQAEARCAP